MNSGVLCKLVSTSHLHRNYIANFLCTSNSMGTPDWFQSCVSANMVYEGSFTGQTSGTKLTNLFLLLVSLQVNFQSLYLSKVLLTHGALEELLFCLTSVPVCYAVSDVWLVDFSG